MHVTKAKPSVKVETERASPSQCGGGATTTRTTRREQQFLVPGMTLIVVGELFAENSIDVSKSKKSTNIHPVSWAC